MSDSSDSSRRKGAQPGNQNALKHGFYTSKFTEADRQDLDDYDFTGLFDEIILLRVYIRRVVEQSANLTDVDDTLTILRALSLASTTITRLLRTQRTEFTSYKDLARFNEFFLRATADIKSLASSKKEIPSLSEPEDP